jgi:hypothetical protein
VSQGESHVRQALRWALEQLAEAPGTGRATLVDQASRRFDLTPLEADFLYRQLAAPPPADAPRPEDGT